MDGGLSAGSGPPEPIIETYVMARGESNGLRPFDSILLDALRASRLRPFDWPESTRYAGLVRISQVTITLNGEPFELDQPLSVTDLLTKLEIDPRRVAVEHNLTIIKRHTYTTVVIGEGDRLEIVNAVGGG